MKKDYKCPNAVLDSGKMRKPFRSPISNRHMIIDTRMLSVHEHCVNKAQTLQISKLIEANDALVDEVERLRYPEHDLPFE